MRDLHDDHVRQQMLDLTHGRQGHVPPVAGMALGSTEAGADGVSGAQAVVHAGDGNGRERASEGDGGIYADWRLPNGGKIVARPVDVVCLNVVDIRTDGIHVPVALAWRGVAWDLSRQLDLAAAVMTVDPWSAQPLASEVPWAEEDEEYRARLLRLPLHPSHIRDVMVACTTALDAIGAHLGLFRARLVPRP